MVKCIEDLREKREEVNRQILKEEEEKAKIQKDLAILTERLSKINESLQRKQQARSEYDQTIQETEAAYMKILESSQTLLHVLKRESVNLVRATATYRLQGVQGDTEEHCFSLFYFFLNSLLVSLCACRGCNRSRNRVLPTRTINMVHGECVAMMVAWWTFAW